MYHPRVKSAGNRVEVGIWSHLHSAGLLALLPFLSMHVFFSSFPSFLLSFLFPPTPLSIFPYLSLSFFLFVFIAPFQWSDLENRLSQGRKGRWLGDVGFRKNGKAAATLKIQKNPSTRQLCFLPSQYHCQERCPLELTDLGGERSQNLGRQETWRWLFYLAPEFIVGKPGCLSVKQSMRNTAEMGGGDQGIESWYSQRVWRKVDLDSEDLNLSPGCTSIQQKSQLPECVTRAVARGSALRRAPHLVWCSAVVILKLLAFFKKLMGPCKWCSWTQRGA